MRIVLTIVLATTGIAHAEATSHDDETDPFVFVAPQLTFGAPLGLFGFEAGVGVDWLRGALGVGMGTRGTQMGVMVRALSEMSGLDVGIGLGASRGPGPGTLAFGGDDYDSDHPDGYPTQADDTTWANAELVVEVPASRWLFTRFFAGASYAATGGCVVDNDKPCTFNDRRDLSPWLPYAGFAMVLRFPEGPSRQTFQLPSRFQSSSTPPPWWGAP